MLVCPHHANVCVQHLGTAHYMRLLVPVVHGYGGKQAPQDDTIETNVNIADIKWNGQFWAILFQTPLNHTELTLNYM